MEMFSLKNRTAIVTGALGLIGKEHCKALSDAGANVIVADLDESKCIEFAKSLSTESIGIVIDVTDSESIKRLRDKVLEKFVHIDVLVNNAAINDMFENPKADSFQTSIVQPPLWDFRTYHLLQHCLLIHQCVRI